MGSASFRHCLQGLSVAAKAIPTPFEFEEGGRTYSVSVEGLSKSLPDHWWWFSVSSAADRQRYAPFRVEPGDTPAKVRPRIVAYYEALLVKRAAPPTPHWRRDKPATATAGAAAPAAAPVSEPVPAPEEE